MLIHILHRLQKVSLGVQLAWLQLDLSPSENLMCFMKQNKQKATMGQLTFYLNQKYENIFHFQKGVLIQQSGEHDRPNYFLKCVAGIRF